MKLKPQGLSKRDGSLVVTLIALLMLIQFLYPVTVAASQIPAKDDRHVYDRGEMFSARETTRIEAAIREVKYYDYYVVTVSSFGELSGHKYASQLYDSWGLMPSDVLTVLSKNDRRIQLYFKNPELQDKLDQLPANYAGSDYTSRSVIDRLIGRNFTPFAKQGKFADGIIALIQQTEKLTDPNAANTLPPTIVDEASGSKDTLTSQNRIVNDPVQSPHLSLKWICLILFGGGCLFVMIVLAWNLHDIRTLNEKLRERVKEVLKDIQAVKSRIELLLKSYDGQNAKEKITELNSNLTTIQNRVEYLLNGVSKGKTFASVLFDTREKSKDAIYDEHVKFIGNYESSLQRIIKKLEQYEAVGISADDSMSNVYRMVQILTEEIEQISYQQQVNLRPLLDKVTHEQFKSECFHVQARENLKDVTKDMECTTSSLRAISKLIQELPDLIVTVRDLPRVLETKNRELIRQIEQKKLDINFDPFRDLHQAMSKMPLLNSSVENGQWESTKQIIKDIDDLICKSDKRLEASINLLKQAELGLDELHHYVSSFQFDESSYLNQYLEVKRDFDEETLKVMETGHDYILQQHNHVCNVLRWCELLYSDRRIKELQIELKNVFLIIDKINNLKGSILNQHMACEIKREQIKESLTNYHDRYTTTFSNLSNEVGIEPKSLSFKDQLKRIDEEFLSLSISLDTYPVKLNQIHASFIQWKEQVEKAINQMDEVLYQCKNAKAAIKQVSDRLNALSSKGKRQRSTHVINTHTRNSEDSLQNLNNLWNLGLYAQVMHSYSYANSNLDQLERSQAEATRQEVLRQSQSSSYSSQSSSSSSAGSSSYYTNSSPSYDNGSSDSGSSSGGDSW